MSEDQHHPALAIPLSDLRPGWKVRTVKGRFVVTRVTPEGFETAGGFVARREVLSVRPPALDDPYPARRCPNCQRQFKLDGGLCAEHAQGGRSDHV